MENLIVPKFNPTHWVQNVPSYTAIVDRDLNLVDASLGWFEHSGLERETAIGKCIYELVEYFDESSQDSFEYALEGISDIKLLNQKTTKSNDADCFVWHLNPWKDGYGNTIGLVITIKEQQDQRGQFIDETSLKAIFENNRDSIIASWEYRIEENLMFWSNEFRNLLALPEEVAPTLKKTLSFLHESTERDLLNKAIKEALTSGTPWDFDVTVKDLKNKTYRLNLIGRPKFKNGRCTRILGVLQKKTKAVVEKLDTAPNVHYDFFDSVPSNLALIDLKTGKIIKVNNAFLSFFGKTQGSFRGKKYNDFISLDNNLKTIIEESLKTKFSFTNIELQVFNKNIGQYTFSVSGNLVSAAQGQQLLLVSCQDTTRATAVEQHFSGSLKQANNEIEKMVHFAHMVSHNLKAHTTNFDLLLNFLTTEEDESERRSLIQMLFQSTENLTSTIKGLRELVAIKHQEHSKKKNLVLNDYVYKVIQSNKGIIKKKNAKIHNEIDDSISAKAIPAYLESILANLVLNGLRFLNSNDRPKLILSAETNKRYTVFYIEDNSMGINLQKEGDKVFGLYKKLKNMGDSTSMGLYLAKYQIELMGGKIDVESTEGKGNVFKVYFPK